ncbi:glycogenin [Pyricularia oryzae 70-15]|uniref:glycogenin glucosyltransferase n=1 Tax=Pyricularia oryzae (strain 70-15 / ATCC MYA-4617 / FGSC 8958) TaxID=242507 RepID=G4N1M3_PYRO7|nr:glycogenin [Pyricularia oryzae 70-15]EHA51595.1 glycogenin [Pyricularia oryzae 70-15]
MAVRGAEEAYITLLLSDNYLPGALVLAHSLRDAGTTRKLAIMVTLDTVAAKVITQLKAVYDYVIPVPRIRNERPANLYLMNRPDLHSAFTKVNLWKQTQFSKLVYIDADVVAYRAPDELFAIAHPFSAAPDIGWPDLFNTGVMVLTPNMGDYYAMMAMAERGISFDGADQGLINMHFRHTYNRISFTYNVTPSAHYQYVPAYRHFQSSINMVHFIGSEKPWIQGRNSTAGGGAFDEMVGRWWAVYDRHYRAPTVYEPQVQRPPEIVQKFVRGKYQPPSTYTVAVGQQPQISLQPPSPTPESQQSSIHNQSQQYQQQQHIYDNGQHSLSNYGTEHSPHTQEHREHRESHHHHRQDEHNRGYHIPGPSPGTSHAHVPQVEESHTSPCFFSTASPASSSGANAPQGHYQEHQQDQAPHQAHEPEPEKPQPPPMEPSWDAQRQPPPPESKPEALNFPKMHYEMSSDTSAFVPPQRYPSPPKNMYYEVPQHPPAPPEQKPPAIFPWEMNRPQASRVFINDDVGPVEAEKSPTAEETAAFQESVEPASEEPRPIPTSPPIQQTSNPWESFSLTNAWDDVPGINRYVGAIQKSQQRRNLSKSAGLSLGNLDDTREAQKELEAALSRRGSTKLTDFPVDRPSLPVTPAPVRRSNFWGGAADSPKNGGSVGAVPEGGRRQLFPAAEGVPGQSDWVCVHGTRWTPAYCPCNLANVLRHDKDPVAQLHKLAKQQSELLLQKLGDSLKSEDDGDDDGSDGRSVRSQGKGKATMEQVYQDGPVKSPTYIMHASVPTVHSPMPVRKSPVQSILGEGEAAVPRTTRHDSRLSTTTTEYGTDDIERASYNGPGAAWDKGEDIPLRETPMPPTEDELDVLET